VARGLGRAGATVVLVGRDPARVEQAVADLLEEEVDATGCAVDVSDAAACGSSPGCSDRWPRSTCS
jgi:NAD(P)-dependent dehydrogenase (short-subunit alcohol dehydrogenase family)